MTTIRIVTRDNNNAIVEVFETNSTIFRKDGSLKNIFKKILHEGIDKGLTVTFERLIS